MSLTCSRRFTRAISLTVAVAVCAASAHAQNTIDQQQTTARPAFGSIQRWNAQTFTPGASNSSGGGFFLRKSSNSTTTVSTPLTIALWDGDPSAGITHQLASSTTTVTVDETGLWADVFWNPVGVAPGATYWLLIGGGSSDVLTQYAPGGSYANGQAWYNYSTYQNAGYDSFPQYDLAFRTYTYTAPTNVPLVTPEPASVALFGAGLVAVGGVMRRRRSAR